MVSLQRRVPPKEQIVMVFASCTFIVYTWAILHFLYKTPGWTMFLSWNEIGGILGYTVAFALVESIIVTSFMVIAAVMLPAVLFRARFVAQGTGTLLVFAFWAAMFSYIYETTPKWHPGRMLLWTSLLATTTVIVGVLVHRLDLLDRVLTTVAERLTIFLYLYLPLGLIGIVLVFARNL
jgi:hypothetical protein